MTTMQNLTSQPLGMSKAKLFQVLKNFSEKTVRRDVNEVIAKSRNIPLDIAKFQRVLKPTEIEQIMERYR